MKNYMPLDGLRCSRDSGSAHCDTPKSAVLGRPGGGGVILRVERREWRTAEWQSDGIALNGDWQDLLYKAEGEERKRTMKGKEKEEKENKKKDNERKRKEGKERKGQR